MPEHAALIAALIIDRPHCLDCIAAKSDLTVQSVRGYLERMEESAKVTRATNERCRVRGIVGNVVSLSHKD